jgi:hypothetical protein
LTDLNVRIASSREVVTAGANAPTIFGRENNTNPKHDEKEKTGYREISPLVLGSSPIGGADTFRNLFTHNRNRESPISSFEVLETHF